MEEKYLNHKQFGGGGVWPPTSKASGFEGSGGQYWYHSSKANLTPGEDAILPSNDDTVGGSNYGYSKHDAYTGGWEEERGDYTFAADTEEEAEAWTPSKPGRPVTYVVDAQSQPYHDFEDQHYMTGSSKNAFESAVFGTEAEPDGLHIKVPGPMPIVDRIDIPRPNHPNEVVQGTLPPQNWGHFNALPKGYEGPATVGQQHPETDNFKRISPAYERMQAENDFNTEIAKAKSEQHRYRNTWGRAGQQSLFRDPYGYEGPEDWERNEGRPGNYDPDRFR